MNLYWTDCSALQMELFKVLRALIEENSLFLNISITAKMKMTTLESLESYKFRTLFSFNEEKPLAVLHFVFLYIRADMQFQHF